MCTSARVHTCSWSSEPESRRKRSSQPITMIIWRAGAPEQNICFLPTLSRMSFKLPSFIYLLASYPTKISLFFFISALYNSSPRSGGAFYLL